MGLCMVLHWRSDDVRNEFNLVQPRTPLSSLKGYAVFDTSQLFTLAIIQVFALFLNILFLYVSYPRNNRFVLVLLGSLFHGTLFRPKKAGGHRYPQKIPPQCSREEGGQEVAKCMRKAKRATWLFFCILLRNF
jgi:hypothetical protein